MYPFRRPRKYTYPCSLNSPNQNVAEAFSQNILTPDGVSRLPSNLSFKTPMLFKQTPSPSPSRHDMWKRELGLEGFSSNEGDSSHSNSDDEPEADQGNTRGGFCSVLELQALQAELNRKEKQREDVLEQLKVYSDKGKTHKTQLQKLEQAKRNQLKIARKSYESQLEEKRELIKNLQELIEEKETLINELESTESVREEQATLPGHSTQNLIDMLLSAQDEKAKTMQTLLKTQSMVDNLENEISLSQNKIQDLETRNNRLNSENDELRKNKASLLLDKENILKLSNLARNSQECQEHQGEIQRLLNKLAEKDKEMNSVQEKHFEELEGLQKKLRQTESKYWETVATPPKILNVNRQINEAYDKRLKEITELEIKSKEQELAIEKLKEDVEKECARVSKLESEKKALQDTLNQAKDKEEDTIRKNMCLLKEVEEKDSMLKARQDNMESFQQQVIQKELEMEQMKSKWSEALESVLAEKDLAIADAASKASLQNTAAIPESVSQVNCIRSVAKKLKEENSALKDMIKQWNEQAAKEMNVFVGKVTLAVKELHQRSVLLATRYRQEMRLRKKYHNELVELKGNIRVFCRVRPVISEDGEGEGLVNVVTCDDEDDAVLRVASTKSGQRSFEVDRVFNQASTQSEVFDQVKSLITSCIDGYNVCIFAYGQTGSGKTYTMEGPGNDPGINQRALQMLFDDTQEKTDWRYDISVNVMEIYNETLRDLLSSEPCAKLEIKQGKEGLYVPGLQHVLVTSRKELNEVFALGHTNRSTASTDMNEHSSRSHAILSVTIRGENAVTGNVVTGKLNLVDLAGSERLSKSGSEGLRIKEAQSINKSLSSLGDVIHALKNKSAHVPYRNSKLTYLLQDSLGGDCKTLMLVQVSPVLKNEAESICSLTFAQRVRSVELGMATKRCHAQENCGTSNRELISVASPRQKTPKRR